MASSVKPARILIVDDELDFREVLSLSFKRAGYDVVCAGSGSEALGIFENEPVQVVISDIRMPGGNGIELLENIRKCDCSTAAILLVTGYADISTQEAREKGAEALFSKPFNPKALLESVSRILNKKKRNKQGSEPTALDLPISLEFAQQKYSVQTKITNLSRTGLFVPLKENQIPNVNDTCTFRIAMKQENTFDGSGIVRWILIKNKPGFPPGCGIDFTYLSEHGIERVIKLFRSEAS